MKNAVFCDVTPCGFCMNRRFHHQGDKNRLASNISSNWKPKKFRSMLWLPVTANVVSSSPILVTLTMEAIRSSEKSVLTRATQRHITEDGILQHLFTHSKHQLLELVSKLSKLKCT
jgi:hypothetical protein